MQLLKERICADGVVLPGNILKVGSFLNQQMDIGLFNEIGREFARRFSGLSVNRIITIESSGIALACITAQYFGNIPTVFAKKKRSSAISGEVYSARIESFTHQTVYEVIVPKDFIKSDDSVLIIDDFLANGCALEGLVDLVSHAGARVVGAGIVIEKGFQHGGDRLRERGIRIESLAIIDSMDPENGIQFRES